VTDVVRLITQDHRELEKLFDRLEELGAAFAEHRAQELAAGPGDDRTKDELYEDARKLDVPGRSKMNKDELATAADDERSS
jgi:hypothetical protein